MIVLRVAQARKRFGDVAALDGASLELGKGELLGLLGPNGAGKTTLVRAVAGRVRLDGGSIEILGRPLDDAGRRGRALGVVPQELALYPQLTARENLEVFGRFFGVGKSVLGARIGWALDWTGLGERAREPVKRFSGGMKRRLNIACGVLHEPEVVLLDEPTVGVDPQSRERIYDMLGRLRARGTSLLLTTHQLEEAEVRCDRIAIMDRGRTVAVGTPAELVEQSVGKARTVTVHVDRPPRVEVLGLHGEPGATRLDGVVADVASELPALLVRLSAAGSSVIDIEVRGPTLQSVFLHFTGKELRE